MSRFPLKAIAKFENKQVIKLSKFSKILLVLQHLNKSVLTFDSSLFSKPSNKDWYNNDEYVYAYR